MTTRLSNTLPHFWVPNGVITDTETEFVGWFSSTRFPALLNFRMDRPQEGKPVYRCEGFCDEQHVGDGYGYSPVLALKALCDHTFLGTTVGVAFGIPSVRVPITFSRPPEAP